MDAGLVVAIRRDAAPTMKREQRPSASAAFLAAIGLLGCSAAALLVAAVPAAPAAPQAAPAAGRKAIAASVAAHPAPEIAMPFRAGEVLNYRLEWAGFANAASLRLDVVERRNLFGWPTWHFRAATHSLAPLRALFAVDDQFDSYTDAATLESHQYEIYLNELGAKQDEVLPLISAGQPFRGPIAPVIVQPGTRDPLGAFYALRATDWRRTPLVRATVYDGSDLYEMEAREEAGPEAVTVAAGKFQATKVSIRLFARGKEVPHTNFAAWLAQDPARTPVLILAEMPMGNVRVELAAAAR
ncbi:MAG: DUF3108 domain-containing protein [Candidatus Acidiferrales bacterium]